MVSLFVSVLLIFFNSCYGSENVQNMIRLINQQLSDVQFNNFISHNFTNSESRKHISHIYVNNNALTTKSLELICFLFPNLEYLDVSHNKITSIQCLLKIPNLAYLDISFNEIQMITSLTTLKHLKYLNIMDNPVEQRKGDSDKIYWSSPENQKIIDQFQKSLRDSFYYSGREPEILSEYQPKSLQKKEIPLTEDLMREHGVLNRILLIYEEIIRRIEQNELPEKPLAASVTIVQEFIENYHEKLEEDYIFPLFEKKKKQVSLVKTLRKQHIRGRLITEKLRNMTKSGLIKNEKTQKQIIVLLKKFITMYRPHEAREDTVLFPQVRSLISEKEFEEMGEKFEALEHELFGEEGFFGIVKKVAAIERKLGIYNLERFTP